MSGLVEDVPVAPSNSNQPGCTGSQRESPGGQSSCHKDAEVTTYHQWFTRMSPQRLPRTKHCTLGSQLHVEVTGLEDKCLRTAKFMCDESTFVPATIDRQR